MIVCAHRARDSQRTARHNQDDFWSQSGDVQGESRLQVSPWRQSPSVFPLPVRGPVVRYPPVTCSVVREAHFPIGHDEFHFLLEHCIGSHPESPPGVHLVLEAALELQAGLSEAGPGVDPPLRCPQRRYRPGRHKPERRPFGRMHREANRQSPPERPRRPTRRQPQRKGRKRRPTAKFSRSKAPGRRFSRR